MNTPLSENEKQQLLQIARNSLESAVKGEKPQQLVLDKYSQRLRDYGASFVTLTKRGLLRGCIGALEPYQPLVQDVYEHAAAAALNDYRFPQVTTDELDDIEIEVSCLTIPNVIEYSTPEELLGKIRPNIDGVIFRDGGRRATFLPQVWEKIPDPEDFFNQLCVKMGAPGNLWKRKVLRVEVYQVEEFSEN